MSGDQLVEGRNLYPVSVWLCAVVFVCESMLRFRNKWMPADAHAQPVSRECVAEWLLTTSHTHFLPLPLPIPAPAPPNAANRATTCSDDTLRLIFAFLPSTADRLTALGVCRAWRAAGHAPDGALWGRLDAFEPERRWFYARDDE